MSFNGSGTFQINTAGQPVVAGTVITATAFNALTADLATGLSTCVTKDGQTTVTANLPMGGNKLTGLGAGTLATDSARLSQVQGGISSLLAVSGIDTITGSGSPQVTAYTTGQMFWFVASGTNTGAATLNIDSLGAKSITRDGTNALFAGDVVSGQVAAVVYNGTNFQLVNVGKFTTGAFGNGTAGAPSITNTGNTDTGFWFPAADTLAVSTAGTERMRINSVGNVGIGTTSPSVRLQVENATGESLRLANTTGGERIHLYARSSASTSRIESQNSNLEVFAFDPNPLVLGTNNAERMRIDSAGNVGIGTTSPGQKLTVVGTIESTSGGVKFPDGTTQTTAATSTGRLVAGTTLVLDPIALNTRTTQAHGLSSTPVMFAHYLECKTAELGYVAGDRISIHASILVPSGATVVMQVRADSTNTILEITNNSLPSISSKTASPPGSASTITAANWLVRVVPYALS